jgi:hypothetical protein
MSNKKETRNWSRWYYGITHLEVYKGGSGGGGSDVATIRRFEDGSCNLWMYNTHDKNLWTGNPEVYYETVDKAMKDAEERLGVKGLKPVFGLPDNHPSNPPECQ